MALMDFKLGEVGPRSNNRGKDTRPYQDTRASS